MMMNIYNQIVEYLQYPCVVYAIIVGTLTALCASILGVSLVLKRFSYIGSSLSNVAFCSMVIGSVFNISFDMPIVLLVTIICAVLLLKNTENAKIKGDATVTMISVGALAIGYLVINIFPTSSNVTADVCTTLFGSTSILTISKEKVYFSCILASIVIFIYVLFYNKIFAITFDEEFASAVGTNVNKYNLLIATITAVIIVLAMQLVGSLLITALIIFPPISAMRVFKSFRGVVICSGIFSIICTITGILISIISGTPVGATIVVVDIIGFIIFTIIGRIRG